MLRASVTVKLMKEDRAIHRAIMDEIKALAREKEHEYLVLKWAGKKDVKEYLVGL